MFVGLLTGWVSGLRQRSWLGRLLRQGGLQRGLLSGPSFISASGQHGTHITWGR